MASVTFKLGIQSSTVTTDKLDLLVEKNVAVDLPYGGVTRHSIATAAATLLTPATHAASMIYVRNLDPTNFIELKETGGTVIASIPAGLFCLVPVEADSVPQLQADTAACVAEVGIWALP